MSASISLLKRQFGCIPPVQANVGFDPGPSFHVVYIEIVLPLLIDSVAYQAFSFCVVIDF